MGFVKICIESDTGDQRENERRVPSQLENISQGLRVKKRSGKKDLQRGTEQQSGMTSGR